MLVASTRYTSFRKKLKKIFFQKLCPLKIFLRQKRTISQKKYGKTKFLKIFFSESPRKMLQNDQGKFLKN
jgi:hypothetical protein